MATPAAPSTLSHFIRKHYRGLKWAWLISAGLLITFLVADALLFRLGEKFVLSRRGEATKILDTAESLLAAGQVESSREELLRYFADSPVRHIKHGRATEHIRALTQLAAVEERLGRGRRARELFAEAVQLDPRNFHLRHDLGACLVRAGRDDEALIAFQDVLNIEPAHLPTVMAMISIHAEAAQHGAVASAWKSYVDAQRFADVFTAGDLLPGDFGAPVDGRWHEMPLPTKIHPNSEGRLRLELEGEALELGEGVFIPEIVVGALSKETPRAILNSSAWTCISGHSPAQGQFLVTESRIILEAKTPHLPSGARSLVLPMRLRKRGDLATQRLVAHALRNLFQANEISELEARTYVPSEPK